MSAFDLNDVLLVEPKHVSSDGRVYVGRKFADMDVKVLLVEDGNAPADDNTEAD